MRRGTHRCVSRRTPAMHPGPLRAARQRLAAASSRAGRTNDSRRRRRVLSFVLRRRNLAHLLEALRRLRRVVQPPRHAVGGRAAQARGDGARERHDTPGKAAVVRPGAVVAGTQLVQHAVQLLHRCVARHVRRVAEMQLADAQRGLSGGAARSLGRVQPRQEARALHVARWRCSRAARALHGVRRGAQSERWWREA